MSTISAPLARWHVGPWTMPATAPGERLQPGRRRTPDELNFDVLGLARLLGRRLSGTEELQVRLWQNELRPTHTRQCGVHTLADPDNAARLGAAAGEAFGWIAARAPAGYRFELTDAVYLRPVGDLDGPVVAVEAVLAAAAAQGVPVPVAPARVAAGHVRRGADGGWYVGDAACVWSGPHDRADQAVAAVRAARNAVVGVLAAAGSDELAATAPRWAAVPVEDQAGDQLATK
jgi:hypothetical protein